MRYAALQDGFIDSHYVCMGEEFEFDGKAPSWARPLDPLPVFAEEEKAPESPGLIEAIKNTAVKKRRTIRRSKPKPKTMQTQEQ